MLRFRGRGALGTIPNGDSATVAGAELATAADLSITKAASAATVTAGDPNGFDYTFIVHNAGPSDNAGYHVSDLLPSGVTFVSGTDCSASGQLVTCNAAGLGSAAPDKMFTVHVRLAASVGPGTLSHTAAVSGVDAGATCSFGDANAADTTITCTDDGTHEATLTATDKSGKTTIDDATVTVANVAPTATAQNRRRRRTPSARR